MLPGSAIADTLFAAPAPGRGDRARAAPDGAGEAVSFDSLLETTQGQQPKTVKAGAKASEGGGANSNDGAAQAASDPMAGAEAPPASDDSAQPGTTPGLPGQGDQDTGLAGSGAPDSGEAVPAMAADNAPLESPASGKDAPVSDDDAASPPVTGAGDAGAVTPAEQAAATPAPAAAVTGTAQTDGSGGAQSRPAGPAPAMNTPGMNTPAMNTPDGDVPPPAGGKDMATDAGKQDTPSAGMPAKDSLAAKASPGQQPQAQPAPAPAAQVPAAQTTPASADTAAAGAQPSASGTPGAAGPAEARAEAMTQPGRADGDVPNAASVRRELERGVARDGDSPGTSRTAAEKSEATGKEVPAAQRSAAAAPSPAPASAPPSAASAPQSFPAMLTALQSGLAAPLTPDAMQTTESGEIRLESGSLLPARAESGSAQAARSGISMTQMRMAPGHAAELGQMIARRFSDGSRSFDIRLDPPELGRVQVRLEIGADRSVQAMLTADKPEALAELQRHARELEKALADAGLDLGGNGIGFALSEGGDDGDREGGRDRAAPVAAQESAITIADNSTPAPVSRYGFLMTGRTGVDMRI